MSRFEEMLSTLLPSMQIRWKLKPMLSQGVRERFVAWKEKQQALDPTFDGRYSLDHVPDEQNVWRLDEAHVLYRDRYLHMTTTFEGYSPAYVRYAPASWSSLQGAFDDNLYRYDLLAQTREELDARLGQPGTRVALFSMHMSHLLRIYQGEPDDGSPLFYASKRLYTPTAPFFGQGFRPLMEALKLHLSGERERVLHPFDTGGGGCVIAASFADRLVAEHLGLARFSRWSGHKTVGQEERYDVRIETFTRAERGMVAAYLAAQRRPSRAMEARLEARLLLCELALRKVIPSAVYVVQAE